LFLDISLAVIMTFDDNVPAFLFHFLMYSSIFAEKAKKNTRSEKRKNNGVRKFSSTYDIHISNAESKVYTGK